MPAIEIPKTVEEREALKKEIQKHLQDLGGDAKSRTVTLKHFMKERNLPPLFVKKAMGRIGLTEKKPNKGDSNKIEQEKKKLQKKILKILASVGVVDKNAIQNVYDTLRKEGIKRRHIRTALFSVAAILRAKFGDEESKLLTSLIRPEQSKGKDNKSKSKPIIKKENDKKQSNVEVQANSNNQNDSKIKGKNAKNVSFTGHFESSGKQGRKIPPTPIVKKTSQSENAPLVKKTPKTPPVAAVKSEKTEAVSPAESPVKDAVPAVKRPATTPLAAPARKKKANLATPVNQTPKVPATPKVEKQMTPKPTTPKQQTPKPVTPKEETSITNASPQNAQAPENSPAAAVVVKTPKLKTPKQETPVVKSPAQESPVPEKQTKSPAVTPAKTPSKSPVNLNGSYIAPNSTGKKNKKNSAVIETSQTDAPPSQEEKHEKTPKSSILKSDNSNSGNKTAGRRVSFGAVKSPDMKTPVNSRKSVNLIDLSSPASALGIMDEECPSLVPINDGSTAKKKKGKSPKFSPRLTRSAARKKIPSR